MSGTASIKVTADVKQALQSLADLRKAARDLRMSFSIIGSSSGTGMGRLRKDAGAVNKEVYALQKQVAQLGSQLKAMSASVGPLREIIGLMQKAGSLNVPVTLFDEGSINAAFKKLKSRIDAEKSKIESQLVFRVSLDFDVTKSEQIISNLREKISSLARDMNNALNVQAKQQTQENKNKIKANPVADDNTAKIRVAIDEKFLRANITAVTTSFQPFSIKVVVNAKHLRESINGYVDRFDFKRINLKANYYTLWHSMEDTIDRFSAQSKVIRLKADIDLTKLNNSIKKQTGNKSLQVSLPMMGAAGANDEKATKSRANLLKELGKRVEPLKLEVAKDSLLHSMKKGVETINKQKNQVEFTGVVKLDKAVVSSQMNTVSEETKNQIGAAGGSGKDATTKPVQVSQADLKSSDQSTSLAKMTEQTKKASAAMTELNAKSIASLAVLDKRAAAEMKINQYLIDRAKATQSTPKLTEEASGSLPKVDLGKDIQSSIGRADKELRNFEKTADKTVHEIRTKLNSMVAAREQSGEEDPFQMEMILARVLRLNRGMETTLNLQKRLESDVQSGAANTVQGGLEVSKSKEVLEGRLAELMKAKKSLERDIGKMEADVVLGEGGAVGESGGIEGYNKLLLLAKESLRGIEGQAKSTRSAMSNLFNQDGKSVISELNSEAKTLFKEISTGISQDFRLDDNKSGDREKQNIENTLKAVGELEERYKKLGGIAHKAAKEGDVAMSQTAEAQMALIDKRFDALIKLANKSGKKGLGAAIGDVRKSDAGRAISQVSRSQVEHLGSLSEGDAKEGNFVGAAKNAQAAIKAYDGMKNSIQKVIEKQNAKLVLTQKEQRELDVLKARMNTVDQSIAKSKGFVKIGKEIELLNNKTKETAGTMKSLADINAKLASGKMGKDETKAAEAKMGGLVRTLEKQRNDLNTILGRIESSVVPVGKGKKATEFLDSVRGEVAKTTMEVSKAQSALEQYNAAKSKKMGMLGSDETRDNWTRGGGIDGINKNVIKAQDLMKRINIEMKDLASKRVFSQEDLNRASELEQTMKTLKAGMTELESAKGVMDTEAAKDGPEGEAGRKRLEQIDPNYKKTMNDLNKTAGAVENLNKRLKDQRGIMLQAKSGIDGMSASLAKAIIGNTIFASSFAVIFGIQNAIRKSISDFIELQKEAARVVTVAESVSTTNAELAKIIGETMIKASNQFGVSYRDSSAILKEFGAAGVDAETALKAFDSTLRTVIATEADSKAVTRAVAAIYEVMADSINAVGGAFDKMNRINDVMVRAFKDSQLDLQELTQGFRFASASAKNVGVGFEELTSLLAVLNNNFIKSGQAGRSLQTTFSQIAQKGPEFARAFNVEYDRTKPLDFIELLRQVSAQMRSTALTAEEVERVFKIFGLEGARSFIVLSQNFEAVEEQLESIRLSAGGAAESASGIATETLGTRLSALSRTLQTGMTQFMQALLGDDDAFTNVSKLVDTLAKAVNTLFTWLAKSESKIASFIKLITRLGVAYVVVSMFRLLTATLRIMGAQFFMVAKSSGIATKSMFGFGRTTAASGAAAAGATAPTVAMGGAVRALTASVAGFLVTALPIALMVGGIAAAMHLMGKASKKASKDLASTVNTLQQDRQELLQNIKIYGRVIRDLEKIKNLSSTSASMESIGLAARRVVDEYSESISGMARAQAMTNRELAESIDLLNEMAIAEDRRNRAQLNRNTEEQTRVLMRGTVAPTGNIKKDVKEIDNFGFPALMQMILQSQMDLSAAENKQILDNISNIQKRTLELTGDAQEARALLANALDTEWLKDYLGVDSGTQVYEVLVEGKVEVSPNLNVDEAALEREGQTQGQRIAEIMRESLSRIDIGFAVEDFSKKGGARLYGDIIDPDAVASIIYLSKKTRDLARVEELSEKQRRKLDAGLARHEDYLSRVSGRTAIEVSQINALKESYATARRELAAFNEEGDKSSGAYKADAVIAINAALGKYQDSAKRVSIVLSYLSTDILPSFGGSVQRNSALMAQMSDMLKRNGTDLKAYEGHLESLLVRQLQASKEMLNTFGATADADIYLGQLKAVSDTFDVVLANAKEARRTMTEFWATGAGSQADETGMIQAGLANAAKQDRGTAFRIAMAIDLEEEERRRLVRQIHDTFELDGGLSDSFTAELIAGIDGIPKDKLKTLAGDVDPELLLEGKEATMSQIIADSQAQLRLEVIYDEAPFNQLMQQFDVAKDKFNQLGPDFEQHFIPAVEIMGMMVERTVQAMSSHTEGDIYRMSEVADSFVEDFKIAMPELGDAIDKIVDGLGGIDGVRTQTDFKSLFMDTATIEGVDQAKLLNIFAEASAKASSGEGANESTIRGLALSIREGLDRGLAEYVAASLSLGEVLNASVRDLGTSLNQKDNLREQRAVGTNVLKRNQAEVGSLTEELYSKESLLMQAQQQLTLEKMLKSLGVLADSDREQEAKDAVKHNENAVSTLLADLVKLNQEIREQEKQNRLNIKNEYNILSNQMSAFITGVLEYRVKVVAEVSEEFGVLQEIGDLSEKIRLEWEAISNADGDTIEMETKLLEIAYKRYELVKKLNELYKTQNRSRESEMKILTQAKFSAVPEVSIVFDVRQAMINFDRLANQLNNLEDIRRKYGELNYVDTQKELSLREQIAVEVDNLKKASVALLVVDEEINKTLDRRLEVVRQMSDVVQGEIQRLGDVTSTIMTRSMETSISAFVGSMGRILGSKGFIPENTVDRVVQLAGKMPEHFKSSSRYLSELVKRMGELNRMNTQYEAAQLSLMVQRGGLLKKQMEMAIKIGDAEAGDKALVALQAVYTQLAQFSPEMALTGLGELDVYIDELSKISINSGISDLQAVMNAYDVTTDKLIDAIGLMNEYINRRLGDIQADGQMDLDARMSENRSNDNYENAYLGELLSGGVTLAGGDFMAGLAKVTNTFSITIAKLFDSKLATPLLALRDTRIDRRLRRDVERGVGGRLDFGSISSSTRGQRSEVVWAEMLEQNRYLGVTEEETKVILEQTRQETSKIVEQGLSLRPGTLVGFDSPTLRHLSGLTAWDVDQIQYRGRGSTPMVGGEEATSRLGDPIDMSVTMAQEGEKAKDEMRLELTRLLARNKADEIIKQFFARDITNTLDEAINQFGEISEDFSRNLGSRLNAAMSEFFVESVQNKVKTALSSTTDMINDVLFSWVDIFNQMSKKNEQANNDLAGDDQLAALQKRLRRNEITYYQYLNAIEDLTDQANAAMTEEQDGPDIAGQMLRGIGENFSASSKELFSNMRSRTEEFAGTEISRSLLSRVLLGEGTRQSRIAYFRNEMELLAAELEAVGVDGAIATDGMSTRRAARQMSRHGRSMDTVDLDGVAEFFSGVESGTKSLEESGESASRATQTALESGAKAVRESGQALESGSKAVREAGQALADSVRRAANLVNGGSGEAISEQARNAVSKADAVEAASNISDSFERALADASKHISDSVKDAAQSLEASESGTEGRLSFRDRRQARRIASGKIDLDEEGNKMGFKEKRAVRRLNRGKIDEDGIKIAFKERRRARRLESGRIDEDGNKIRFKERRAANKEDGKKGEGGTAAAIGAAANTFLEVGKLMVGGIMQMASMDFGEIADSFMDMISDLPAQISDIMNQLIERLPSLFEGLAEAIPEIVSSLFDQLPELIQTIMDGLSVILPALISEIPNIVKGILEGVVAIIGNFGTLLKAILESVVDMLPDLIINLLGSVGEIIASIISQLPMIVIEIVKAIPKMIAAIFKGLFKGIGSFFKGLGSIFKKKKKKTEEEREAEFDAALNEMDNITNIFPKYHEGGLVTTDGRGSIPGLNPDEVPAILQAGEYVLTAANLQAIKGGLVDLTSPRNTEERKQAVESLVEVAVSVSGETFTSSERSKIDESVLFGLLKMMTESVISLTNIRSKREKEEAVFKDAPKFHSGGIITPAHRAYDVAGLANDEVPAVLQTGEAVLNRQAVQALGGGSAIKAFNGGTIAPSYYSKRIDQSIPSKMVEIALDMFKYKGKDRRKGRGPSEEQAEKMFFHEGGTVTYESKSAEGMMELEKIGADLEAMTLLPNEVPVILKTGEGILTHQGLINLGGPTMLDLINSGSVQDVKTVDIMRQMSGLYRVGEMAEGNKKKGGKSKINNIPFLEFIKDLDADPEMQAFAEYWADAGRHFIAEPEITDLIAPISSKKNSRYMRGKGVRAAGKSAFGAKGSFSGKGGSLLGGVMSAVFAGGIGRKGNPMRDAEQVGSRKWIAGNENFGWEDRDMDGAVAYWRTGKRKNPEFLSQEGLSHLEYSTSQYAQNRLAARRMNASLDGQGMSVETMLGGGFGGALGGLVGSIFGRGKAKKREKIKDLESLKYISEGMIDRLSTGGDIASMVMGRRFGTIDEDNIGASQASLIASLIESDRNKGAYALIDEILTPEEREAALEHATTAKIADKENFRNVGSLINVAARRVDSFRRTKAPQAATMGLDKFHDGGIVGRRGGMDNLIQNLSNPHSEGAAMSTPFVVPKSVATDNSSSRMSITETDNSKNTQNNSNFVFNPIMQFNVEGDGSGGQNVARMVEAAVRQQMEEFVKSIRLNNSDSSQVFKKGQ